MSMGKTHFNFKKVKAGDNGMTAEQAEAHNAKVAKFQAEFNRQVNSPDSRSTSTTKDAGTSR